MFLYLRVLPVHRFKIPAIDHALHVKEESVLLNLTVITYVSNVEVYDVTWILVVMNARLGQLIRWKLI